MPARPRCFANEDDFLLPPPHRNSTRGSSGGHTNSMEHFLNRQFVIYENCSTSSSTFSTPSTSPARSERSRKATEEKQGGDSVYSKGSLLLNAITYSWFVLMYAHLWLDEWRQGCLKDGATQVVLLFLLATVAFWMCFWGVGSSAAHIVWACIAYSANLLVVACMNIHSWPHTEMVVVPQYLWTLLCLLADNVSPAMLRAIFGGLSVVMAGCVAQAIPGRFQLMPDMPSIIGGILLYYAALYVQHICSGGAVRSRKSKQNSPRQESRDKCLPQFGFLFLVSAFACYCVQEMFRMVLLPNYAKEGGYNLLKAALFACVGFASSAAFGRQVDRGELLERMVRVRTDELRQRNYRLEIVTAALEASNASVAILDEHSRIQWCNAAFSHMAGRARNLTAAPSETHLAPAMMSPSALAGLSLVEIFRVKGGDELAMLEGLLRKCGGRGTHRGFELPLTSEGSSSPCMLLDIQLESLALPKQLSCSICTIRDVTAQNQLKAATDAAKASHLESQIKTRMMQILSHEMRTPLQGIIGTASILLEEAQAGGDKGLQDNASMILAASRVLLVHINNSLDQAKMKENMLEEQLAVAPVLLSPCLREAVQFVLPFATVNDVRINAADIAPGQEVIAHGMRLQQICINILGNGIKYARSSLDLSVHVGSLEDAVRLAEGALAPDILPASLADATAAGLGRAEVAIVTIKDDGRGLPAGGVPSLFQEYGQLANSALLEGHQATQPMGTGLGLNLSRRIVHSMGGRIWANNRTDTEGAEFSFFIPSIRMGKGGKHEEKQSKHDTDAISSPQKLCKAIASQLRVLVIDDTLVNLKIIQRMLLRIGISRVDTALSGDIAAEMLRSSPLTYNVVLTDQNMPGTLDGKMLLELAARESLLAPSSLRVLLSAVTRDELSLLMDGKDDIQCLCKPVSAAQLESFLARSISNCHMELQRI
jgi:signal transduction histidine kinase